MKTIRVEKTPWLTRVIFDLPGEKVNKLSTAVMAELDEIITEVSNDTGCEVVSFESAKKNVFIAGADIEELRAIKTLAVAREKGLAGQTLFSRIAALVPITVAVIDGACVGGGCELALACDFRVATDSSKTQIGLPEVQLGIIPGWGGTQRLPRLIGLPAALAIILAGKTVDARKAKQIKLVDQVIAATLLEEQRADFLEKLRDSRFRFSLKEKRKARGKIEYVTHALLNSALGRTLVITQARKNVMKKSKGCYPAPLAVLDLLSDNCSIEEGMARELAAFAELAVSDTSKNLVALFFLNEQIKKDPGSAYAGEIIAPRHVVVLGAGVMGGGIAWLMSHKGVSVRMKEISWDALALGYGQAADYFAQLKKRRRIKQGEIDRAMNRIGASIDYQGMARADLVIEAVVENMAVKKQVLAEAEQHLSDSALLCSNSSALSITEMAKVLQRPANFCGMHFFNPVNRMPLVEIVRGQQSSDETIARAVAMVKSWGKSPIVVSDCPGFLVNRILLPYMNEALYLLEEGADIEMIDKVVSDFGLPIGPFALADQVGIDVGYKVAKILQEGFGQRMAVSPLLTLVYEDLHLLGKKSGAGFYKYSPKKTVVNRALIRFIPVSQDNCYSAQDIIDRLLLIMVNEAARCLQEGVVANAGQLDFAMVMGIGFPPWRGGLCRWADAVGLQEIVKKSDALDASIADRYQVTPYLRDLAAAGRGFYS